MVNKDDLISYDCLTWRRWKCGT